jgi:hypothetical protein
MEAKVRDTEIGKQIRQITYQLTGNLPQLKYRCYTHLCALC